MYVRVITFLIVLSSIFCAHAQDPVGHPVAQKPLIDFFALMEGAEEISVDFNVQTTIDSEYKIKSIQPYIYLPSTEVLTAIDPIQKVTSNLINLRFQHPQSSTEYLLLHVKYTPRFVIDGKSETVCVAKFYAKKIFEPFRCDSQSASKYLLASLIEGELPQDGLVTPAIAKRLVEFESLPDTQSWQNYQAILTILLSHVAEQPHYSVVNLSDQYLVQFKKIVARLNEHLLQKRQFDIKDLDTILLDIDHTMTNVGYRIYMVIDSFIDRMKTPLPYVHSRPTFVREFFAGLSPFTLLEPESQKLAAVNVNDQSVQFIKWPWFDRVEVQLNDSEPFFTTEQKIPLLSDTDIVVLRPYGKRGRYSRTSLVVRQPQLDEAQEKVSTNTEVGDE